MAARAALPSDPPVTIANWLFGRLAAIGVGTVLAASVVVELPFGVGFLAVVSLAALWLTVQVVFSALDRLLEVKLSGLDASK